MTTEGLILAGYIIKDTKKEKKKRKKKEETEERRKTRLFTIPCFREPISCCFIQKRK